MTQPTVTILMATYNGAAHLSDQLASIAAQEGVDWRLIVSDDGSLDGTGAILTAFQEAHPGHVTLLDGPGQGGTANFRSLIARTPPDASWVAFSDQDDVWMPQKLIRAVRALEAAGGASDLSLYCSRTRICAEDLTPGPLSRPLGQPVGFHNALFQSVAGGNTMVFGAPLLHLLQAADQEAGPVVVHDWWIYQLVSGAGGRVIRDDWPSLLYRQHGGNQIGSNQGVGPLVQRIRWVLDGTYSSWGRLNHAALLASADRLTPENRARLELFGQLRTRGLIGRVRAMRQGGFRHRSRSGQILLWGLVILNRM